MTTEIKTITATGSPYINFMNLSDLKPAMRGMTSIVLMGDCPERNVFGTVLESPTENFSRFDRKGWNLVICPKWIYALVGGQATNTMACGWTDPQTSRVFLLKPLETGDGQSLARAKMIRLDDARWDDLEEIEEGLVEMGHLDKPFDIRGKIGRSLYTMGGSYLPHDLREEVWDGEYVSIQNAVDSCRDWLIERAKESGYYWMDFSLNEGDGDFWRSLENIVQFRQAMANGITANFDTESENKAWYQGAEDRFCEHKGW